MTYSEVWRHKPNNILISNITDEMRLAISQKSANFNFAFYYLLRGLVAIHLMLNKTLE